MIYRCEDCGAPLDKNTSHVYSGYAWIVTLCEACCTGQIAGEDCLNPDCVKVVQHGRKNNQRTFGKP